MLGDVGDRPRPCPPPAHERGQDLGRAEVLFTCWRSRSTAARSVQSAATPIAVPPTAWMAWTTVSSLAWSRPLTATLAPLAASSRQVAAPMPPDPPVTTATF